MKGEDKMAEFERITNKLNEYLIKNMGFKKNGRGVSKVLVEEKDIEVRLNKDVIPGIEWGDLYCGRHESFYDVVEENYISDIEERFDDFLKLTDREAAWLDEYDEDGCLGWDRISEYIWDYVDVAVSHTAADKYFYDYMKYHFAA